jgi:hypothetical protein
MEFIKEVVSFLVPAVTALMTAITVITNILNRRDRPRKILKWLRPSFTRVQSTEQLPRESAGRNVPLDKENHETLFWCEIRLRNSGKAPITKQPILIEFDPEASIRDAQVSETIPEKEFGPISEDRKLRSQSQRRYRIALMNPDDCVTFRFLVRNPEYVRIFAKSEGLETKGPERTHINEPQTEIGSRVIWDRLKNLIVTPSIIIATLLFEIPFVRVIIAVALIVAGVFFIPRVEASGLPINSSLLILVWTIIVFLGWLIFQYGGWAGSWRKFRSSGLIEDKTGKTPFGLLMAAANSTIVTLVAGTVLVIIALSVTGHGDLAMKILDIFFTKIIKIVQAIFT